MGFNREEVSNLLAQCHRRCCICHRFCGVKMETDHMKPTEQGGTDDIGNAIPLCFECHAEVHAYNDLHPRGRKYTENELRKHKQQWLQICQEFPNELIDSPRMTDPGPLTSLETELEYNQKVSGDVEQFEGLTYRSAQFERSIYEGILSLIDEELKNKIMEAYSKMERANTYSAYLGSFVTTGARNEARNKASRAHRDAAIPIKEALEKLKEFLKRDTEETDPE